LPWRLRVTQALFSTVGEDDVGSSRPGRSLLRGAAPLALFLIAASAAPVLAHPELDEEIEEATQRIASAPDPAVLLMGRGELYRIAKDWKAAQADYDLAAALNPKLHGLELCRAALTLDQGHGVEARAALDKYLGRNPREAEAWTLRSQASEALRRHEDAAADVSRVIELTEKPTPDLYVERSRLLVNAGQKAEALRCLDDGITRLGPVATLELAAVDLEVARGNTAGALARVERVEAQMERPEALLTRRAEILAAAGDAEGARRAREAAAAEPSRGTRRWIPGGATASQDVIPTNSVAATESPEAQPGVMDDGRPFTKVDRRAPTSSATGGTSRAGVLAEVVTRGPYLQVGTPTGITVRWRTDVASTSRVLYGTSQGSLTSSVQDGSSTTEHEIRLTGLTADQRYYYAIGTTTSILEGDDAAHSFVTSPTPGTPKPARLWVIGDAGTGSSGQAAVRDAFTSFSASRPADVWLMLGDNAYNAGTDSEYQTAVFNMYRAMLKKNVVWPTRGNHDVVSSGFDYYDIFSLPTTGQAGGLASGTEAYYSYDYGNIHFICLDSEGSSRSTTGAMATWLKADLAATGRDWVIAYWHHPPYTKGSHDSDNISDSGGRMRDMRANILPILDSLGVDIVLTGHSHSYERSFLLDRHYGTSGTLTNSMKIDAGNGREGGDGAYSKATLGTGPHEGCVYAVAGSSGHTGGGSLNVMGSMVVDIDGNRLDARFLDDHGSIRDSFTILKGTGGAPDTTPPATITDLGGTP